ncbi:MAG: hypothetical protein EON59_03485 [Alphaproteobacteria bacterium]|nr:MAG: hypothetical protein EON59_03485 [Alphaproteobacteria bacterium]
MSGVLEGDAQALGPTAHHAKYFAWELTRRRAASEKPEQVCRLFDSLMQGYGKMNGRASDTLHQLYQVVQVVPNLTFYTERRQPF